MDPGKKEILKENLTVFEELGFGIEVADNSKVKLTKVPHCDRIVLGKYLVRGILRVYRINFSKDTYDMRNLQYVTLEV